MFLESIASACGSRSTYRFQFPYKTPLLSKYASRSEEHNLLKTVEPGSGRRGTTYAFDYAYCVAREVPTHLLQGTEKIDRSRSVSTGEWSSRVAQISEELVNQAHIPKDEGKISYLKGDVGFVDTSDGKEYFCRFGHLIEGDRGRQLTLGQRVRFYPAEFKDGQYAFLIELI